MDVRERGGLPAPLGLRLGAALIDAAVLGLLGLILGLAFGDRLGGPGSLSRLVGFPFAVAYLGLAGSRLANGQTAGKSFLGLKVVDTNGHPLSVARSLVRASLLAAPWFFNGLRLLPVTPFAGHWLKAAQILVFGLVPASLVLFLALPLRRQFLHDLVAGSFVVRAEQQAVPAGKPSRWAAGSAAGWILLVTVFTLFSPPPPRPSGENPMEQALLRIPGVSGVTVVPLQVTQQGRTFRALRVVVSTNSGSGDAQTVVRKAASAVLAFYPQLNQFEAIQVQVLSGVDVGLASWNTGTTETHSPDEWRASLETEIGELLRGPERSRVP